MTVIDQEQFIKCYDCNPPKLINVNHYADHKEGHGYSDMVEWWLNLI